MGGLSKSHILSKAQFLNLCNGYKNTSIIGVVRSIIQQTYIQEASHKLGSEGEEADMSMSTFNAVGETR